MNAIQVAINSVKNSIPRRILEDVFLNRYTQYRAVPISIEERIRREVVLARVLPDCQLRYGNTTYIPLTGLRGEQVTPNEYVYHIPKDRTGGLAIMSALSIAYLTPLSNYGNINYLGSFNGSVVNEATSYMLDAHDVSPVFASSRVTLVGENTILIKNAPLSGDGMSLYCILENDQAINHLKPKSIAFFKQLVLLAVKAYIYNELILEIDQARLVGGHDLGKYREIVESYADADEMYNEKLTEIMGVVFFLNDEEQATRHIRLMLGGPR